MDNILRFYPLDPKKLSTEDLAGLSHETIFISNAVRSYLGTLGIIALDVLIDADGKYRINLVPIKSNPLTELIAELDKQRDNGLLEIKRDAKAAEKSSDPQKANAGKELITFIKPYDHVEKEPIMTETSTLFHMRDQYNAKPPVQTAAATLQLTGVFNNLFVINEQLFQLWNERALNEAENSSPSPSSIRSPLETAYRDFCDIVIKTIKLQPSPELEKLFAMMNEIRIKYSMNLPVKLTDANTITDPIPIQKYTGKPIRPIPCVFFKKDTGELSELQFTIDFYVTYRNNVDIGDAQVIIHGKGKYTGSYIYTFNIV
jgi:hypothetical protein